jgi:UDP-N-acetylmuramyl pentapeptide phosphotransferase/UDP-N-acetylglucosamine-1-phosphate transferase
VNHFAFAIYVSAITSFVLARLLVHTAAHHGRFSMDMPGAVQKFHSAPTPRIGGIGVYVALGLACSLTSDEATRQILKTILIGGLPCMVIGLAEDLTKKVGAGVRLSATFLSGLLACSIGGVTLTHLHFPVLDGLLAWGPAALFFTAFAIAGVSNAINIVDGFNGLASGTAILCLLALAAIAYQVGDTPLVLTAGVMVAALVGFWLVNFPWGKLFLGDGGAYFSGFALAWIAVLLPMRNASVSPWASLLVCAYPIIEVIYSIARRRMCRQSPAQADCRHLHSLVAIKVITRKAPGLHPTLQNSTVSVLMWGCAAIPGIVAMGVYQNTATLVLCAVASAAAYHLVYHWLDRS